METRGIAVCDDEKFVHEEAERLFSNYQNKGKYHISYIIVFQQKRY